MREEVTTIVDDDNVSISSQLLGGHLMTDTSSDLLLSGTVASHCPLNAQCQRCLDDDEAVNGFCKARLHKDGTLHHNVARLT